MISDKCCIRHESNMYGFAGLMLGNSMHKFNGNQAIRNIIDTYQASITNNFIGNPITIDVGDYFGAPGDQVVLNCLEHPGIGVAIPLWRNNGEGVYQYDLRTRGYGRPKAWRVPFLADPNYGDVDYTVSHLCHNSHCYNWRHHALEPLSVNKARNGCPGGLHCHHTVRCIRPGKFFDW